MQEGSNTHTHTQSVGHVSVLRFIHYSPDYLPLSDFGVVKSEAHVAVPAQSELMGLLQGHGSRGRLTGVLEFGHNTSLTLTVVTFIS